MSNVPRNMKNVSKFYFILFFILGLYITYVMGIESTKLTVHPDNPRLKEDLSRRGRILDRAGKPLALSRGVNGRVQRLFPMDDQLEPLLGYLSPLYGKGGLEDRLDKFLVSPPSGSTLLDYISRHKPSGQDVYLTIDADLQLEAEKAMQGHRGAVVVMNPQNGEILALVSTPSFDPRKLDSQWKNLVDDKNSPFLLRPVEGLYPPGSIFKLFSYAICLEDEIITPKTEYNCTGDYAMSYPLGTYHIHESGGAAHGKITAKEAIVYSCNISMAQMIQNISPERFVQYADEFGLTKEINFISGNPKVQFPKAGELTNTLLAQSSFGQGEIALSPLRVALLVSCFAAEGKIYEPQLIKARRDDRGKLLYRVKHRIWKKPISRQTASRVKEAMTEVVIRGSGTRAAIRDELVAGKTGSAENPDGDTHAWFAGFAPATSPEYLAVVIVENGGGGGVTAAPIAKRVLEYALKKGKSKEAK